MPNTPGTTGTMEKIVQEGTVGFREGRPILENVVPDEDIGYCSIGRTLVPYDLKGKRVRVTIEILEDAS